MNWRGVVMNQIKSDKYLTDYKRTKIISQLILKTVTMEIKRNSLKQDNSNVKSSD